MHCWYVFPWLSVIASVILAPLSTSPIPTHTIIELPALLLLLNIQLSVLPATPVTAFFDWTIRGRIKDIRAAEDALLLASIYVPSSPARAGKVFPSVS